MVVLDILHGFPGGLIYLLVCTRTLSRVRRKDEGLQNFQHIAYFLVIWKLHAAFLFCCL